MKVRILRRGSIVLSVMILIFTSCGCSKEAEPGISEDILTQKTIMADRIPITVLVKYGFTVNTLERVVEKRFPDIDLIQVGNYTFNGSPELAKRFEHDDFTDIVLTWPLETGEQYWEERLLDLSGMPFTNNYNISVLDSISKEGKLYYLPGPSEMRGLVYNKTLFKEQGWSLPNSYEEFITLCNTIEDSGIRALQLNFWNAEILDAAFCAFDYGNSFSSPESEQKRYDYDQEQKGSLADFAGGALDNFQQLIDEGIIREGDLEIRYPHRGEMLFTRACAMVDDSPRLTKMDMKQSGCSDQFALMPFFSPGEGGDWVQLNPSCYIGLNKHLAEPQNQEKYDAVMDLMSFFSTKEGQVALAGDSAGMVSSVNGVPLPDTPEIEALSNALNHGRSVLFPTLQNAQPALREGLAGMLKGTKSKEDVIKMTDAQNVSSPIEEKEPVIGLADKEFTLIETGNFVTDAMRAESETEIALFLDNGKDGAFNAKGISAKLYKGDLTEVDIRRILPVLQKNETGDLWKIKMTGKDLIKTLEYSIDDAGWFYYFSGLKVDYAPEAKPGSRIRSITDIDGKEIDPKREYSIAVTEGSVPEEFIKSCDKTGVLISDIIKTTIVEKKIIAPSEDGRFHISKP